MTFCTKCGKQYDDGTKFCPYCGAANESKQGDFSEKLSEVMNTADSTAEFDASDIESNKVWGILAYLSWLVLIPLFAAPKSKFARFHTNQGLVLAIAELVWWVVEVIIGFALGWIPVVGTIVSIVLGLVNLVFLALAIVGIINVATGRAKQLPVIGKIVILK